MYKIFKKNKTLIERKLIVQMTRTSLLCMLFFLIALNCMALNGYSQTVRLSMKIDSPNLKDAIVEIKKQTEFDFLYSKDVEPLYHANTQVKIENGTIEEVLNQLFKSSRIDYQIIDKTIVLTPGKPISDNTGTVPAPQVRQGFTITGKVIDNTGEGLPGVTVQVKGTTTGTATNVDGSYSIAVPGNSAILVFSFVGFSTQEIEVGNQRIINVTMSEDVQQIDEVVVVGYGVMRKSDLTSSITKIGGDELNNMNQGNVSSAMQGMAPGVLIITGSGAPGVEPTVMVRGVTSVNLSSSPLYVIDGMPMSTSINHLNPADIESIEVLKDASAAAIYGSMASNGGIMITTKRGLAGKPVFNADIVYGFQMMKQPYEMCDVPEYIEFMNAAYVNSGSGPYFPNPALYAGRQATPWWKTGIAKTAPQMNANISVRGGTDAHKYSASIGYYQQDSFLKLIPNNNDNWQRFTARYTSDFTFSKVVSAGLMFNPRFEGSYGGSLPSWSDFMRQEPITPIYKPADELNGTENEYSVYARSEVGTYNPVAASKRFFDRDRNIGLGGNAYIDIKPLPGMVFKSYLGYDYRFRYRDSFQPDWVIDAAHEKNELSIVQRWHDLRSMFSWQNTLTYLTKFDKHNFTFMVGNTMDRFENRTMNGSKSGLPNNSEDLRELSAATINPTISGNYEITRALLSYFGRVNYNYDNRYLLTATLRRDGSSKFMERNKWANFPSVSVAWQIANEGFMKSLNNVVNSLKLRVGWGQVGNQGIPSSVYESLLIVPSTSTYYAYNEQSVTLTRIRSLKNEDVKWETVEDTSFGVDFGLWRNKLSGSVDYYIKNTKDMLFQKPYPYYSGFPTSASIWTNVGAMRSQGVDIQLNYKDNIRDFNYGVTLSFTTVNIKVTEMSDKTTKLYGANITNTTTPRNCTALDEEPGYFYGYITDGLFQNQAEVDAYTFINSAGAVRPLQPYARPGDIRFKKIADNGQAIGGDDRTKIGSPWADFTAGLNINMSYKGFDLLVHFYGSYGNELSTYDFKGSLYGGGGANKIKGVMQKTWHGEGTSNDIPIVSRTDLNENYTKFSEYFVEDASYLKMKNLQLGYTLPRNLTNQWGLSRVRVYISGQNLLTLTNYSGTDPEVSGGGRDDGIADRAFGFAGFTYPQLKTILFGVNVGF